ncbi:MAG: VWA domain-containing protein [Alcaligenaceae bacterium]|nr:VWA domain-containing protein [Alcaligenaceae bacterium]
MNTLKTVLHAASVFLLAALVTPAFAADKPLLREGKKTLYQRVLTTPGCEIVSAAGARNGKPQPAFSRFYVYERKQSGTTEWLKIGPDSFGKTVGWMNAACTVDWKMQMTLVFSNPANRNPVLFFESRDKLESIIDAPDPSRTLAPMWSTLKKQQHVPGILARDPEYVVDIQKKFYLLPILSGEEVMSDAGFRMRMLNVASVSEKKEQTAGTSSSATTPPTTSGNPITTPPATSGNPTTTAPSPGAQAAPAMLKEFSASVVFVIDASISMNPYIQRTQEAIRKVYDQIESEGLNKQVRFGLIAFRSNVKAVPGLEYTTRMYANPNEVKNSKDFFNKVSGLKQANVSSTRFDEDSYAGVMQALNDIDWSEFGARYIVLITDAGALDGSDPLSSTGLNASQVRLEAGKPGVAIYTLHLKTPSGAKNHASAESQYRDLSNYTGTNTTLYYPVNAGDVNEFGRKVDALASAIASQVKSAYLGEDAVGSAVHAKTTATAAPSTALAPTADAQMLRDAELIGHAMRLTYLGSRTGTEAPAVFKAWITDRDLISQDVPTVDVRVLLTKSQLSDLYDVLTNVMQAASAGKMSSTEMFDQLRSLAASMSTDPNQIRQGNTTQIKDMGIMAEFLEDLPYQSPVLSLDEETWSSWDVLSQEKFIRELHSKLRLYQSYNNKTSDWISLAPDSDPRDFVYPVPLEAMP